MRVAAGAAYHSIMTQRSDCVRASVVVASLLLAAPLAAQAPESGFADAVLGRWDLTVELPAGTYPSWLELRLRKETELMGRFVGRVGSARYVSDIQYAAGRLVFGVPTQYESGTDELRFEGTLRGDRIEGTARLDHGETLPFTAVRAPALAGAREPVWAAAVPMLNGRDLAGWTAREEPRGECWSVTAGVLAAKGGCTDLISNATFRDFRLHAEVRFPPGSNSGVYLRGRYEVQIQDDAGKALDPLRFGGVYGFVAPSAAAARPAGEWQTLDIELVGRAVTVVLNGTSIIDAQEIPGITGGALDSDENAPGPIMLQGDHGAIEFRNLTIAPPR